MNDVTGSWHHSSNDSWIFQRTRYICSKNNLYNYGWLSWWCEYARLNFNRCVVLEIFLIILRAAVIVELWRLSSHVESWVSWRTKTQILLKDKPLSILWLSPFNVSQQFFWSGDMHVSSFVGVFPFYSQLLLLIGTYIHCRRATLVFIRGETQWR